MNKPLKRSREDGDSQLCLNSLERPISPPNKHRRNNKGVFKSPWQLTWIRDLPESKNKDAVSLKDILGDPLISECWEFNYLHDISFLMQAFDEDVRHLVKIHVVHGFWKNEDPNRAMLLDDASKFTNVTLHAAPMPEMFGTHHSKMMVLFRHDETAQVVIHTANMIPKDWTNMTNAVWLSPRLPRSADSSKPPPPYRELLAGSGEKFKADLLAYLRFYDRRKITCKSLSDNLAHYDFSAVKGSLIASVPGRHKVHDASQTAWGWAGVKKTLHSVPCADGDSEVVAQVSSIATLGPKDDWLQKTLFGPLSESKGTGKRPRFKVIFPTADEIRRSLDGYESGGSIHTKIQSVQQARQLEYLRPIFHHWANDSSNGKGLDATARASDGGRSRAAPHIKTYIRYNDKKSIDWALLTSANISKQAWGEAVNSSGESRVASWEIGVLVWPDLFEAGSKMLGTFMSDTPDTPDTDTDEADGSAIIGVRVPYSLPLQRYGEREVPWVATMNHREPDWMGRSWIVQ